MFGLKTKEMTTWWGHCHKWIFCSDTSVIVGAQRLLDGVTCVIKSAPSILLLHPRLLGIGKTVLLASSHSSARESIGFGPARVGGSTEVRPQQRGCLKTTG